MVEDALSVLARRQEPLEQGEAGGEDAVLALYEHGDLASGIDPLELIGHVLQLERIDMLEVVFDLRVLAGDEDGSRVRAEVVSIDL